MATRTFDKRMSQTQQMSQLIGSANSSIAGGHLILGKDFRNKENLTVKQSSKKVHAVAMMTNNGATGSSQSIINSSHVSK